MKGELSLYGTGLGLSIVKHAEQYYHGEIVLKSKRNEGTIIPNLV